MNLKKIFSYFRTDEYKALIYRISLIYFFYFVSRVLFTIYNLDLLHIDSVGEFLKLAYYGLVFDTTAIIYINLLFIVLSTLPLFVNTHRYFQRVLLFLYFITNLIAISTNFLDFGYYRFNLARSMSSAFEVVQNESNLGTLLLIFLKNYWHIFLLFFVTTFVWIYLYKLVKVKYTPVNHKIGYVSSSVLVFLSIATLMTAGVRGDLKKSTRPINLVDANRFVDQKEHADIVLNTVFTIIRTIGMNDFKKVNFVSQSYVNQHIQPIKIYHNHPTSKPNIVIFIMESFGREYSGAFNRGLNIPNFKSYTPFLDSLATNSLIFSNAYANGRKSIHAMSSILAGIPSFKTAYTSSFYPNQKTQSLVSILNDEGYDTSFFHGAPNGSMGFQGFGNILGFDHYYGKTEYNNDADFDGVWAIWDEPFFKYMSRVLSTKKTPFMATLFSASSHDPFQIPKEYEGKFPAGTVNIHKCIGYSDNALRQFFKEAKTQTWFNNTIFVITGDHCNTSAYKEYKTPLNLHAVPILFYKPDNSLQGEQNRLAQQIDIYPTLIDLIGYQKPFRSWGNSLVYENPAVKPFYIGYAGTNYQFVQGNYVCLFDGQKATGFYNLTDKNLSENLILSKAPTKEMLVIENNCKAFLQDYFQRIVDRDLYH